MGGNVICPVDAEALPLGSRVILHQDCEGMVGASSDVLRVVPYMCEDGSYRN